MPPDLVPAAWPNNLHTSRRNTSTSVLPPRSSSHAPNLNQQAGCQSDRILRSGAAQLNPGPFFRQQLLRRCHQVLPRAFHHRIRHPWRGVQARIATARGMWYNQ